MLLAVSGRPRGPAAPEVVRAAAVGPILSAWR